MAEIKKLVEDIISDALMELEDKELDCDKIEQIITSNGCKIEWGDSGIEDGCDNDEDDYLMYQSFDIVYPDGSKDWVTIYYGDCSYTISEISYR